MTLRDKLRVKVYLSISPSFVSCFCEAFWRLAINLFAGTRSSLCNIRYCSESPTRDWGLELSFRSPMLLFYNTNIIRISKKRQSNYQNSLTISTRYGTHLSYLIYLKLAGYIIAIITLLDLIIPLLKTVHLYI
jgi:hypothetical protein